MKNIIILLILTIIVIACKSEQDTKEVGSHEVPVRLATVETKKMVMPVFASGLMFSETQAILSFKTGGIIQQIYVDEGELIRKGQLLATLDLTEINAQVSQADQAVKKAKRDLDRIKSLYEDEAATLENVQDLTTVYNVSKDRHQIARFNQQFSEIRATSDGRVVKKMKNQGELVGPGVPIFYINDTSQDQWKLEVGVADKDWARLSTGDKAEIKLDAYPDYNFEGTVFRMAEGADPSNGSYLVELQLFPGDKKIAAGLFGEAKIIPSKQNTYQVIPIEALVEGFGNQGYVFIPLPDNKVKKVVIEIAFVQDNQIAVKNGLEHVQEIICSGVGYLTEISKIKLMAENDNLLKTTLSNKE